jgi:hypothetical protein
MPRKYNVKQADLRLTSVFSEISHLKLYYKTIWQLQHIKTTPLVVVDGQA